MKRIYISIFFLVFTLIVNDVFAQKPNNQRKKHSVKKTVVKPLPPPPPPPAPAKEPTMEETREWLQKKINQYKPVISFTSSIKEKDQCEWIIEHAMFDTSTNNLTLLLKPDVRSVCYKDQLNNMVIDLALIDIKKTTPVETSKKVLIYQQNQSIPFQLKFPENSPMSKTKMSIYSATISFEKCLTYETNLTTRFGKALNKMSEFKGGKLTSEKEAY
jgi:hypothetical protein